MVGLILTPRILSPYAVQIGTICILLFWVAMLVVFSDYVEGCEDKNCKLKNYPPQTQIFLVVLFIISVLTFIFKNSIFNEQSDIFTTNARRVLYLFHPVVCVAWLPKVYSSKRINFLITIGVLTLAMAIVLVVPNNLDRNIAGKFLNALTSEISAKLLTFISDNKIMTKGDIIFSEKFSIRVGAQCGSSPQIFISLFSILVCYISCRIKSYIKILAILSSACLIAFFINTIRITLLGYIVDKNRMSSFDFWHEGAGSLVFSFIVMTMTCGFYYFLWSKENPLD